MLARLLVHNAETALRIQRLHVCFKARNAARGLEAVKQLSVNAVPRFVAQAEIRSDQELHVNTEHGLQPGRSWHFELQLPHDVVSGVQCVVTARLEGWEHSRILSASMNADGAMAVTYVDTLPPTVSVVMMSLTAYGTAAVLMLLMLEEPSAASAWRALLALAVATAAIASVLHRLLRPNHPYVALGYQATHTLAVRDAQQALLSERLAGPDVHPTASSAQSFDRDAGPLP